MKHIIPVVEPGSISEFIWREKYQLKNLDGTEVDKTIEDTHRRVAKSIARSEVDPAKWEREFYDVLSSFEFVPAGRILSGAGTGRDVTLINCYVMGTVRDSMDGIMDSLKECSLTMKQGGGIGVDFSTLRPRGAEVKGVGSYSSGAVSFMDMWHAMCGTIMSAGARRGAMMGTLRVDHPDIEEFVTAKHQAGRLTNFNVSVLVTDAFMEAVRLGKAWDLVFDSRVYKTVDARELWDKILHSTYEYAEPGVIFIDQVNNRNPLRVSETISASNPCGEQMLPPYGACVLGSLNLAMFVINPFSEMATLDWSRLREVTRTAVRFLDNVITESKYPLEEQRLEANNKRRIGLGVTGLADALVMMGIPYGSETAKEYVSEMMEHIEHSARTGSEDLGREKGHYPIWRLEHGPARRNSHLMSIAPTGTISTFAGNVSGGIEPVFGWEYNRNVLMPDGSKKKIRCADYALRLAEAMGVKTSGPEWVTATELSPRQHIDIVSAAQAYIDSAISKTINCDADMPFEEFGRVYDTAYSEGLKGCTTYRPSGVRGAVLEKIDESKPAAAPVVAVNNVVQLTKPLEREPELLGKTYKLKPAGFEHALYITINDIEVAGVKRPFEIFFNSKAVDGFAWTVALSRMISAIFRKGGDISFVGEELKAVFDPKGGFWHEQKYMPSLVAAIGHIIERHMGGADKIPEAVEVPVAVGQTFVGTADLCPSCHGGLLVKKEGCWSCTSCTYSKCG